MSEKNEQERPRFRVANVGQIVGRGRYVSGEVLSGVVRMGMILHAEHLPSGTRWRVTGVEFADSPSTGEYRMAFFLDGAQALDELRRVLPAGSILAGEC